MTLTMGLSSANANGYVSLPENIIILGGSTPYLGPTTAGAIDLAAYLEPGHTRLTDFNYQYSSSFGNAYLTVGFFWNWSWTSGTDPTMVTNDQIEFIATFHKTGGTETLVMGPYPYRPADVSGGAVLADLAAILAAVRKTY